MTDIIKTNEALPAHLQKFQATTEDGISKGDIVIPYIKKVERLSKEVSNNEAQFGEIINSVTKQVMGPEVKIVPVKYFKDFKNFNKSGQLEDISKDCKTWENSGKAVDTNDVKAPDGEIITRGDWQYEYHNFYVLVEGEQVPFILSMGKTSNKEGKLFLNLMQQQSKLKGLAVYTKMYELSAVKNQDGSNEFCVWKIKTIEGFTPEDTCTLASEMQETISKYVVSHETVEEIQTEKVANDFGGKVI